MSGVMWTYVSEPWSALQQRIYLSLLGSDVWRQYREGAHQVLLCDMYGGKWRPAEFVDSMLETLQLFLVSGGFTADFRARLAAGLAPREHWSGVAFGDFGVFHLEAGGWVQRQGVRLHGVDDDGEVLLLLVLGACVGAYMNGSEDRLPSGLINEHVAAVKTVLADLWFEVCDAALSVGDGCATGDRNRG